MAKKAKNRAWFIDTDGRAPYSFCAIFDDEKNKSKRYDCKWSKPYNSKIPLIFHMEPDKWSNLEYMSKWDFLPNTCDVPLANPRALKVLEEVASGQFEAVPTEVHMPDGTVLTDYKLINVLTDVDSIDFDKSIISERNKNESIALKYESMAHRINCLKGLTMARDKTFHSYLYGSTELKKAIKAAKLTGLTFQDGYGSSFFVDDENDGDLAE